MSSGFVSGGTTDAPIERDDQWLAAQAEIEANRRRKDEALRKNDGRSLFETLEANKGTTALSSTMQKRGVVWALADHAAVLS